MATVLTVGDIAIVQYNSGTTDTFTFVFLIDVEVRHHRQFHRQRLARGRRLPVGRGHVTYTAPSAITAGTTVTLSGLNLDDAGDQIIAYQGAPATPTILHVVDLADGNNTVAGDATNDNTTALPPGFALNLNAVAVGFDNAIYGDRTAVPRRAVPPHQRPGQLDQQRFTVGAVLTTTGPKSISTATIRRLSARTTGPTSYPAGQV